jgi:hypothetical protein
VFGATLDVLGNVFVSETSVFVDCLQAADERANEKDDGDDATELPFGPNIPSIDGAEIL